MVDDIKNGWQINEGEKKRLRNEQSSEEWKDGGNPLKYCVMLWNGDKRVTNVQNVGVLREKRRR